MADLADADHVFGNDIGVSPTGDIALATKSQRTIQRIMRRLMTAPTSSKGSAYPWEPDYGVGLGAWIGQDLDFRALQAEVRSQMLMEASVQRNPPPVIAVTPLDTGGAAINITYTDLSGVPRSFNFNLSKP